MTKRVLIAGFKHETNTFSKLPTDIDAYRARGLYYGEEMRAALAGTNTEIAGFLDACDRHGWEPVLSVAADATPSGLVTAQAYDEIAGCILKTIDDAGPLDAVLLQLHGALVAEGRDDAQGDLLADIRKRVGSDTPVGVTLDLHANITDRVGELSTVLIGYRTYPHVDQHEIATQCADLIARTLAGEIAPKVWVARGAQLDGVDHGRTTGPGPMPDILTMADGLIEKHGLLAASINAGFPWADIPYVGPTAVVVADAGNNGAEIAVNALRDEIWRSRETITIDLVSAEAAIAQALEAGKPGAPFVIADFADNPGGGGYGDSTGLLRAMIEAGLENAALSSLYDPECVAACEAAGEGAELELQLGGKLEPRLGPPITASGTVIGLYDGKFKLEGPMSTGVAIDIGPAAVFRVGRIDIVLASKRAQNYDRQFFRAFGIEPTERSILAVKSAQHFRADYAPIACRIAVVDEGGGITSHNFRSLDYRHVRRPVWPLDDFPEAGTQASA
ncbi:MAG: M81 family metallopeptidase [Hyphomicrobiales bacterium]|nr:M81 family metallopeptidase [Hyphomicrobiales bacterium]